MINIDEINKQKEFRKARSQEDKLNNDNRLTSCPPDICSSYRQALQKIKEIAEKNIRIADMEGLNGVYRRGLAKEILQKISEISVGCSEAECRSNEVGSLRQRSEVNDTTEWKKFQDSEVLDERN